MRIALLAHPRHPIRPPFMGGMEAHSWHLAAGLMARGHDVTLFAAGDSDPALKVHPVAPVHYEGQWPADLWHGTDALNAHTDGIWAAALPAIRNGGFDVVHNNTVHRFPPRLSRALRLPMVTSLHVPPFRVLKNAVHDSAAPWHMVTVTSRQQRERWWDDPPPTARVVPNGIDLAAWPFHPKGDGTAVWAGRIHPNKGTAEAARAARLAGVDLTIYGTIEDRGYFEADVAPLLGEAVRYGGHLAGADLAAALGRASVLLFTPMWDEPFGLAAVEALACGLPIAAFRNGAVEEVVGSCGRFADPGDVEGLARVLSEALKLSRSASRRRAEERFALTRMLDDYEALYAEAISAREVAWPETSYSRLQLALSE